MAHVLWLEACGAGCADRVGGKALGLGSLLREGLPVPPGFVVTTDAYRECVVRSGLHAEIIRAIDQATTLEATRTTCEQIRARFEQFALAETVSAEIAQAYHQLSGSELAAVAVRSSAIAEDRAEGAFAGLQDTYLWLRGAEAVQRSVARCWGSLFTLQAVYYRQDRGVPADQVAMGVVVQRMVPADVAGVMMTIDPVTGDRSQIVVEASYGLGLAVVGGEVNPDRYCVDKVTLELRSQTIGRKHIAYHFDPALEEVRAGAVPENAQERSCLEPEEVLHLARLGKRIERAFGAPQDIEWAIGPGAAAAREVFLLQARPETVWSQRRTQPLSDPSQPIIERMLVSIRQPLRLTDGPHEDGGLT